LENADRSYYHLHATQVISGCDPHSLCVVMRRALPRCYN